MPPRVEAGVCVSSRTLLVLLVLAAAGVLAVRSLARGRRCCRNGRRRGGDRGDGDGVVCDRSCGEDGGALRGAWCVREGAYLSMGHARGGVEAGTAEQRVTLERARRVSVLTHRPTCRDDQAVTSRWQGGGGGTMRRLRVGVASATRAHTGKSGEANAGRALRAAGLLRARHTRRRAVCGAGDCVCLLADTFTPPQPAGKTVCKHCVEPQSRPRRPGERPSSGCSAAAAAAARLAGWGTSPPPGPPVPRRRRCRAGCRPPFYTPPSPPALSASAAGARASPAQPSPRRLPLLLQL